MLDAGIWNRLKRGPQVIALKDAAAIAATTGLQSGDTVLDAGSGSGWLAVFLGSVVAPEGKVFSFERKPEFAQLARRNVEKAGLQKVVEIVEGDAFAGFGRHGADLVTLDLAEAEKALAHAKAAVREGGWIAGYFTTVEQAQRFAGEAEKLKLLHVRTVEVCEREWKLRSFGSRPEHFGAQFTALLCFLRKISDEEFDRRAREIEGTKAGRRTQRIRKKLGV